ncbi:MAG TPA: hypothetical protein VF604_17070 [Pyrinomonadaceae bacterium]|jgi:hypothetical protein
MRLLCIFFLTLFFVLAGAAQDACRAEVKDAPALFGLKLGMSPAQAQNVFGRDLKIKNKRNGEYTFFQNFIEKPAPNSLNGIRALYLRFFDGSLYQIEIFYEDSNPASPLENFINAQSAKLNLPVEAWKIKYGIAEISCGAFSLAADKFLNPRLQLTDETTLAKVEAKRKKD